MTLAILCPGQGAQDIPTVDALLDLIGGDAPSLIPDDLLRTIRDPAGRLFDNAVAQPLICSLQGALWSRLRGALAVVGIAPALFAGYSVGELSAYGCAGALTRDDVVDLARRRARLMDAAGHPGDGLVALRGSPMPDLAAIGAHLAIRNGDDQWIVGGSSVALAATEDAARASGLTAHRLAVAVAAHTPLLTAAVPPFRDALVAATWHPPTAPVLAGIDGTVVRTDAVAIDRLSRQIASPIRWATCMDILEERGTIIGLELGPGQALGRLLRERHPHIAVRAASEFRSIDAIVAWVVRQQAAT